MPSVIDDYDYLGKRARELGHEYLFRKQDKEPFKQPEEPTLGSCYYCQKEKRVCDGQCWGD